MKQTKILAIALFVAICLNTNAQNYNIVDTGQNKFFNNKQEIEAPLKGEPFYGQDAQYKGNAASYTDNGNGTITDNVTGLMWQKGYEVMTYPESLKAIEKFKLADYDDWRIPTIKEAYSLILFNGSDVNPKLNAGNKTPGTPFINTDYFDFKYGANGHRAIDSQMLTSTLYVGSDKRNDLVFGVNFADGRIKGYGLKLGNGDKPFMVRFVRGNKYGINNFLDNGNGTITDNATKLMWSQEDSKKAMNWEEALTYAQEMNARNYLGYSDWRVPNAKELQSIVDYSRSPLSTSSAAISTIFKVSLIKNESGVDDYPFYWTSTTHENSGKSTGSAGIYVAFGRSLGNLSNMQMIPKQQGEEHRFREKDSLKDNRDSKQKDKNGNRPQNRKLSNNSKPIWVDVHGAGSQRSDPKSGDPSVYANGHGPQGDVIRINNYVRLVRDL